MTEARDLLERFEKSNLPDGWTVEMDVWRKNVHLVAPERKGGVIVSMRYVSVQLPSSGPSSPRVEIYENHGTDTFSGRRWKERIIDATLRAAWSFGTLVREHNGSAHRTVVMAALPPPPDKPREKKPPKKERKR